MNKPTILVVEGNVITAKALNNDLKYAGYNVLLANSADAALKYIQSRPFDLMIIDINLEDALENGIDLVKKLNKTKNKPVIYLTASGDDDTLEAISGTDHSYYLSKPYDCNTLLKVIKLTIFKYKIDNMKKIYLSHNTSYDISNKLLFKDGKEIKLTTKENLFLAMLINKKNQIVNNDEVIQFIWLAEFVSSATLRRLVSRVRAKLEDITIETHYGLGYRLKI